MEPDTKGLLTSGAVEVIDKDHLEEQLASGKKLCVKFGIDPTTPDLHLGHAVSLRKLRQFQDAGHRIVLVIGDFTAQIGDPTGRSKERQPLNQKEIKQNVKGYLSQLKKIIDVDKAELRYNSEWFLKKGVSIVIEVLKSGTVNQVIQRAEFKKRIDDNQEVTLLESLYPLLQGYDSVEVGADLEIGGTDQKFNLLMGRRVQRHFGMPEQDIMTLPLLEGMDGVRKMSKSYGNYVGLTEKPNMMFGKLMSIPDTLIDKYYELCAGQKRKVADPREAKLKLARIIVEMYHGVAAAQKACDEFIKVFSNKDAPEDVAMITMRAKSLPLAQLLVETKMVKSKSEARRLIKQRGVKIDGAAQSGADKIISLDKPILLQVGKRKFLRISS